MGRKRIREFEFRTWAADHPPPHAHIFVRGRPLGKWDILRQRPMEGFEFRVTKKLLQALYEAGYLRHAP